MNIKKWTQLIVIALLGTQLSACKGNLTSTGSKAPDDTPLNCESSDCVQTPAIPEFTGKIESGSYSGLQVIRVDAAAKELVITIPTPLPIGKPMKKDINSNDIEGGFWELKMYESNKWAFELHLPLKNFIKGKFTNIPAALLPNGWPLPKVATGELPGFAVKWDDEDNKELFLYLGGGNFAIFVPTYNFDPTFMIEVPIKNKVKDTVGWFITIPETEEYYGGFYMAGIMPENLATWVDDNLQ